MTTLKINGIISDDTIEGKKTFGIRDLISFLSAQGSDKFNVELNSIGGSIQTGDDIYDVLKSRSNQIESMTAVGECASIAVKIFLSVEKEKRFIDKECTPMIHLPLVGLTSDQFINRLDFDSFSDELAKHENAIVNLYAQNTILDKPLIKKMLEIETEFTAEEFVNAGFAFKVIDRKDVAVGTASKSEIVEIINLLNMSKNEKGQVFSRFFKAFNFKNIKKDRKLVNVAIKALDSDGTEVLLETAYDNLTVGDELIIGEEKAYAGTYEVIDDAGEKTGQKIVVDEEGKISDLISADEPVDPANVKTLKTLNINSEEQAVTVIQELTDANDNKDALIEQLQKTLTDLQAVSDEATQKAQELETEITNLRGARKTPKGKAFNFGAKNPLDHKGNAYEPKSLNSKEMRDQRKGKK